MERDLTDQNISIEQFRKSAKLYEDIQHDILLLAIQNIPKDLNILDLGCGPGDLTVKIAKHFTGNIHLVDKDLDYLENALDLCSEQIKDASRELSANGFSQCSLDIASKVDRNILSHILLSSFYYNQPYSLVVFLNNITGYFSVDELESIYNWLVTEIKPEYIVGNFFVEEDQIIKSNLLRDIKTVNKESSSSVYYWDLGWDENSLFSLTSLSEDDFDSITIRPLYNRYYYKYNDFKIERLTILHRC